MTSPTNQAEPDPGLLRKAKGGDREALCDLIDLVSPMVGQWALAWTGDSDSASDLSQEVLIRMVKKLGEFRGESRFLTWVYSVTRNQAIEAHRRIGRKRRKLNRFGADPSGAPAPQGSPDSVIDADWIRRIVDALLQELPRRQREVFHMSEVQGLSSPEIGVSLGLAPGAVRAALFKARRTLRRRILESHPELVEDFLP